MKVISAILTAFLFLPIIACSLQIFTFYYGTDSPLIPDNLFWDMAKPYIIIDIGFIICMLILIYLNVKKKYTASVIISSGLILVYLIVIKFIGFQ